VGTFTVCTAGPHLPEGLTSLADEAEGEGIRNVGVLVQRWTDGTERFDGAGERLLVAIAAGAVVGVGGLSRCPDVEGALRVRRFFVSPSWRRRGVARALATDLIDTGLTHVGIITCNARASDAAGPFWERMGFEPVHIEGITHLLRRGRGPEPIHDDEPDTSEVTVRALLAAELPALADLPMTYVCSSGTTNAMWRLRRDGRDLVVRLPRRPHAADGVDQEVTLLRALSTTALPSLGRIPTVHHAGAPHGVFPHRWSVLNWLDGTDAWSGRGSLSDLDALAGDLAEVVLALGDLQGLPVRQRARARGRWRPLLRASTPPPGRRDGRDARSDPP